MFEKCSSLHSWMVCREFEVHVRKHFRFNRVCLFFSVFWNGILLSHKYPRVCWKIIVVDFLMDRVEPRQERASKRLCSTTGALGNYLRRLFVAEASCMAALRENGDRANRLRTDGACWWGSLNPFRSDSATLH